MTSTNTAALEHRGQAESDGPALDVAVVGAGQAGLAMAWHLRRHGLRFAVLDAATQLGQTWRTRWDSLRLFTPARFDALPEMPFPGPAEHYPTKEQVADYLHDYATAFDLPIRLDHRVLRLSPDRDGYRLQTTRGAVRARQVVVATGPFQTPHVPEIGTGLARGITQLHSSAYRNPDQLPAGPVLVVGDGNSGRQIAAELAATRRGDLATSGTATALPQRLLGRDLFWWLTRLGLLTANADSPLGRRIQARGELVIGTTDQTLRDAGVTLRPRLVATHGTTGRFADGSTLALDTVIWATGYRPDHAWIDVPGVLDGNRIVHDHGHTAAPGLYVLGQPWQRSRGAALLGFVARDAGDLAHHIAAAATRRNHRRDTGPEPRRLDPAPALTPTSPRSTP